MINSIAFANQMMAWSDRSEACRDKLLVMSPIFGRPQLLIFYDTTGFMFQLSTCVEKLDLTR